jgi:hypothetical protein
LGRPTSPPPRPCSLGNSQYPRPPTDRARPGQDPGYAARAPTSPSQGRNSS